MCLVAMLAVRGHAQTEMGTLDWIITGTHTLFVFKPASNTSNCANIDVAMTTPKKAEKLGQRVFAETLIHRKTFGYVYWLTKEKGLDRRGPGHSFS
jgi:hypothetical protein